MNIIIPINKLYVLEATPIDCNGNFASGLTINYEIRKSSDASLVSSGALTEQSDGAYIATHTFTEEDQYRITYISPNDYENGFEKIFTETADFTDIKTLLDNILLKVCKILGLSQSNYKLTDQVYNANGCLTSARILIYPSATDLANDTNRLATYDITATYNVDGFLTDYTVVEV